MSHVIHYNMPGPSGIGRWVVAEAERHRYARKLGWPVGWYALRNLQFIASCIISNAYDEPYDGVF